MTYAEAKICLPAKAKLHSKEPEGELYYVGKVAWWLTQEEDGSWNCFRPK